jgi:dipeptidase
VSGSRKTPPNKSQALSPPAEINTETRKAKPKTEFWRATETNRLSREAYKKAMLTAQTEDKQTGQRQKPNGK